MAQRDARHWQRYRIENQTTQPLALGNLPFRAYLSVHHLSSLEVARITGVRYMTTWNIEQNKPIRGEHAAMVRAGLLRMTGIAYTGPIAVHTDERPLPSQPPMHERRHNESI